MLADRSRREVADLLDMIRAGIGKWADIVGEFDTDNEPLPSDPPADLAVVLGGDGTPGAFSGFGAASLDAAVRLRSLDTASLGPDVELLGEVVGGFDPEAFAEELRGLEGGA